MQPLGVALPDNFLARPSPCAAAEAVAGAGCPLKLARIPVSLNAGMNAGTLVLATLRGANRLATLGTMWHNGITHASPDAAPRGSRERLEDNGGRISPHRRGHHLGTAGGTGVPSHGGVHRRRPCQGHGRLRATRQAGL